MGLLVPLPAPNGDEDCPLFAAPLNNDGCCVPPDVLPVLPKSVELDAGGWLTVPNKLLDVLLSGADV